MYTLSNLSLFSFFVCLFFCTVPEYEVISPIQVDDDNRFLSHNLNIHARQKRHAEEPHVWYYNVKAFGMSLHLNLRKNEQLMSPWLTVERHENGTVTSKDPPHNTFFNGHVNSKPGSLVAVSNENGLVSSKKGLFWKRRTSDRLPSGKIILN